VQDFCRLRKNGQKWEKMGAVGFLDNPKFSIDKSFRLCFNKKGNLGFVSNCLQEK
jgi:hypothetical protein